MIRRRFTHARHRGMTILYAVGFSAVLFLIVFAMADAALHSHLSTARANDRAQAQWIADAGITFARTHPTELRDQPTLCGSGSFECHMSTDSAGRNWVESIGRVPATNPRATITLRAPLNP